MSMVYDAAQGAYFGFELAGVEIGFFTSVNGLSSEIPVITHKTMSKDGKQVETKFPDSRRNFTEVVLKRGVTSDKAVNTWFDETVDAGAAVVRKLGSIVIYTRDFTEIARFNLENCFPSKLTVSDLNAKSGEAVVEELTIRHENLVFAT